MSLWIIGTDEAGYGPDLGPLVISASFWEVAKSAVEKKQLLPSKQNRRQPSLFDDEPQDMSPGPDGFPVEIPFAAIEYLNDELKTFCNIKGEFPIVDSKLLYNKSKAEPLEKSVITAILMMAGPDVAAAGQKILPVTLTDFLTAICRKTNLAVWENRSCTLPVSEEFPPVETMMELTRKLGQEFQKREISLRGIRSRRIMPKEYNDRGDINKSDLLGGATMGLVRSWVATLAGEDTASEGNNIFSVSQTIQKGDYVVAACDKLGGRNFYRPLLMEAFPGSSPMVIQESSPLSVYRLNWHDIPMEIRFQAKGERNLPTALASLFSKYLRELSMAHFNRFWQSFIPELKETAGYPGDSGRFLKDIESVLPVAGIPMDEIWRKR